jgi:hypothetical protein
MSRSTGACRLLDLPPTPAYDAMHMMCMRLSEHAKTCRHRAALRCAWRQSTSYCSLLSFLSSSTTN